MSDEKRREVLQVAQVLFEQTPDWVTFFRELLGLEGAVRTAYPDARDRDAFEQSEEYRQIEGMLGKLRMRRPGYAEPEPTTVITVRLPKSLHESLKVESEERRTSMNKLCIAKLLQKLSQADAGEEGVAT